MKDRFIIVDKYNKMICEGFVKELFRGDAAFQVEHGLHALEKIKRGHYVRFVFQAGRRGIFEGKVIDVQNSQIILEEVHSIAKYVKEDVRIDTYFETKAFRTDEAGQIFAWDAVVADISAGGICLMTEVSLPVGQVLDVAIPYYSEYIIIPTDIMRELEGDSDIERIQTMQMNDANLREMKLNHSYGCKFHEVTNVEENMVRSMVFQIAAKKASKKGGR